MKIKRLFNEFFESEKAGGLILVFVTIVSLVLANSPFQTGYIKLWNYDIAGHSIVHWINDGLMAIFFLLIGLELEREIYHGELSSIKSASMPIFGALGGMFVPAGIFLALNFGTETQSGAGIPMATDIAFAIGIMSLLGNRVPASLKIFLIALAVIDDLGAIIIIAVFYTTSLSFLNLSIALGIIAVLGILNRLKVHNLIPYILGGVVAWYFMLLSGVHATITGVLLAFVVPYGCGGRKSPSYILQHILHKPVAFIILPLFAMANTSIAIGSDWLNSLGEPFSLGIIAGLVLGKPIGIVLFSIIAVWLGLASLPEDLKWGNIIGAGFLGGIGFTMSIFITLLAFDNPVTIDGSKIAILIASCVAACVGFITLKLTLTGTAADEVEEDD
jgi:Na+:H+ antiporter, NhaA family